MYILVITPPTSVKMFSLKGIGFLIFILADLANCQSDDYYSNGSDDYEYSGDDHDQCDKPCDFYDDVDCAKECHHDKFLEVIPLKIKYGAQVKTCCSGHQYFFHDYCEVRLTYCLEILTKVHTNLNF